MSPLPPAEEHTTKAAYYTVCVLALVYTFSMVDRLIPALLIEDIKQDLSLTDTQVSLLTGFAFAAFYSTTAVPIARIADAWSRKGVIVAGLVLWSVTTVACGFSRSFWQFFIARLGVGVGEAALTPSAIAIVSESFPPHRQSRGMAIFATGASIGVGLSLVIGGLAIGWAESVGPVALPGVGELQVWQMVLIGVGFATLLTLIPLLFIVEPHRATQPAAQAGAPGHGFTFTIGELWRHRAAYAGLLLGAPMINLASYGFHSWAPTYFIRVHDWKASEIGFTLGGVSVAGGLIGLAIGSFLSDHLRGRGSVVAPMHVLAASAVLAGAVGVGFFFVSGDTAAFALIFTLALVSSPVTAVGAVALQAISPAGVRAQIGSFYLLMANLIGIGFGPTGVALMTDYVFGEEKMVGASMAIVASAGFIGGALLLLVFLPSYRRRAEYLSADRNDDVVANHRSAGQPT